MEMNRFFRYLWNFNAVVVAVSGLLVIAVLTYVVLELYDDLLRPWGTTAVVRDKPGQATGEELSFGGVSTAKGWHTLRIPLQSRRAGPVYGSGKSAPSTRNFLFHDLNTGGSRWLFPTHDQVIADHRPLTVAKGGESEDFVLALYYEIVKDDTNGDGRLGTGHLGAGDRIVIALTLPDGQGYKEVVGDADRVIGTQAISDDVLIVMYQSAQSAYAAKLSLPGFELLSTTELAVLGSAP
jgi:hypothetical protein